MNISFDLTKNLHFVHFFLHIISQNKQSLLLQTALNGYINRYIVQIRACSSGPDLSFLSLHPCALSYSATTTPENTFPHQPASKEY
jgi:hypothetical protein